MSISRNNHYVPQMYLQKWGEVGQVHTYTLLVPHEQVPLWKVHPIKRTGSRENLYVRIEDNVEYDDFEHFFAERYESPAKKPIDKACKGESLSPNDWEHIINFLCAQYVRTPYFQQLTQKKSPSIILNSLDQVAEELNNVTPEEIKSKTQEHLEEANLLPISFDLVNEKDDNDHSLVEINVVAGKNIWLFAMKSNLKADSALQKFMHNLKWSIVSSFSGIIWPTSDNPVITCNKDIYGTLVLQKELGLKWCTIIMPISPTKVLVGTQKREYDWRMKADKSFSEEIKSLIIDNAFLNVYSNFADRTIPIIRPRLVDEDEFQRITEEYSDWFKIYKDQEGPLLKAHKCIE